MRKKVTYIVSDVNRAQAFEWIATSIDKQRFDLDFIIINAERSILEDFLRSNGFTVKSIYSSGKKDWLKAFWSIFFYLKRTKPQIVHCHLQQASILGLSAAKLAGVPVRLHTRHHSSLHHVYFPKGVYWDKLINRLSTYVIAISRAVERILREWEGVPPSKIVLIPHGFLLDTFVHKDEQQVAELSKKYGVEQSFPVIGVVSRFTEWKGVQYIIPAFRELLTSFPDAVLMLFNATGDYSEKLIGQLLRLPEKNYRIITFEPAIASAYHLFDVCVHVPVDDHSEAFGQVYIEALAAGVPLVATLSGVANDILEHGENAWVVPYRSSEGIREGIQKVLTDKGLSDGLRAKGKITASEFSLQKMMDKLEQLYATV